MKMGEGGATYSYAFTIATTVIELVAMEYQQPSITCGTGNIGTPRLFLHLCVVQSVRERSTCIEEPRGDTALGILSVPKTLPCQPLLPLLCMNGR